MSSNVSGTLHTYPDNWRAFKVLIAAKYSGANVVVSPNFVFGQTNKTADFLKKFPLGKVPAFETKDGKCITESNAIAFYVSNEQLRGKNDYDKAKVLEWCDFADGVLLPPSSKWVFPCMGITQYNKQVAESAKEEIKVALSYLNAYLLSRTYLVSERITLADIVLACTMMALYKYVLDPSFRTPYPNVNRWFVTVVNQPQFKSVAGEFKLCDKMAEFDAQKFAELQGKSGGDSKGKGGQASKKAEQAPKKEGKAKVAAEPAEEMDEAELALAAEPKSKDPFDELPKGTFNMDDFKRCYSNEDVEVSIPYFWEKFDKENYSIWFGEYKYNNELQKVFMSCNLISGMFQRLEKMRKQAFASMCLFGKDNDSSISGIWVWRGHNLAFELSPDWKTDYDVYAWKKLNPDDLNAKKLVEQYFAWTGKDSAGRPFNQGKIFK